MHLWIFRRLESQRWTDWSGGPAHLSGSRNGQIPSKELCPSSTPQPPERALVSPGLPRTAQQSPRLLLLQGSLTSTLSPLLSGGSPALCPPPGVANRDKGLGGKKKSKNKNQNKTRLFLGRGCRSTEQHEDEQRELQAPCQAVHLAVWGWPGAGLPPGREPLMESCKRL